MSRRGSSATRSVSVQQARENLRKFLRTIETVPGEELERSARVIKQEAVAQVPYKTGKLEHSIYVRVSKDKRRGGIVAGASARSPKGYNYAGIQHENTDFQHKNGRKAHFISDPFNREVEDLKRRLRDKVKFRNGS